MTPNYYLKYCSLGCNWRSTKVCLLLRRPWTEKTTMNDEWMTHLYLCVRIMDRILHPIIEEGECCDSDVLSTTTRTRPTRTTRTTTTEKILSYSSEAFRASSYGELTHVACSAQSAGEEMKIIVFEKRMV